MRRIALSEKVSECKILFSYYGRRVKVRRRGFVGKCPSVRRVRRPDKPLLPIYGGVMPMQYA